MQSHKNMSFCPKWNKIGSIKARDMILMSSGLNDSHGSVIDNARFLDPGSRIKHLLLGIQFYGSFAQLIC